MSKITVFLSLILLLGASISSAQEEITFTTYYPTPGRHLVFLLLILITGILRRRLSIKKELPFLLIVAGNLLQFYSTAARTFYYLLPSYAILSIVAGNYIYLEAKNILTKYVSNNIRYQMLFDG